MLKFLVNKTVNKGVQGTVVFFNTILLKAGMREFCTSPTALELDLPHEAALGTQGPGEEISTVFGQHIYSVYSKCHNHHTWVSIWEYGDFFMCVCVCRHTYV